MALPNGTAAPAPAAETEPSVELTSLPPVVGINFGNSYASIAVFTKEGLAECIANEDGERQIACAVSFHGEEMYIGNQAKHQLVKNAQNTITGFRNLLGKKFSEVPQSTINLSAAVIQHPDLADTPAYKVRVLQPSPSPLPPSNLTSGKNTPAFTTPAASNLPTPRSEPIPVERYITPSEATTIFLRSLVSSAEAFLGKKVKDAVITVPSWFSPSQRTALNNALRNTGVNVLQLLDEAGAAAATTTSESWGSTLSPDRTQLVIDVGASSTSLHVLSIRSGLSYTLASHTLPSTGGDTIDSRLISHFSSEFTKKTKTPLSLSDNDPSSKRAEAKLRLALEHTKRTISASPGAATCSVESLKDGIDFTSSINRMRFDLVSRPIYTAISSGIQTLLSSTPLDAHDIDEIAYIGGSTSLPGLDEHIILNGGFREDVETPFTRGVVVGGGVGDPTTILARGCAVQAHLISTILDAELRAAFAEGSSAREVKATTRTVGVLLPNSQAGELGGTWIPVVHKETTLPARRNVRFDVEVAESNAVAVEVWEVSEGIRIEKVKPPKVVYSDDEGADPEEEEEEEEIEVKHKTITKETLLGVVQLETKLGVKAKGKGADGGKTTTTIDVQFIISVDAGLSVSVKEFGAGGAEGSLSV
ncbi:dnaK-type molecular chaperone bipA [Macrolepiota fuliginosa MF-IS2]|uniref:DnaK-type molecular chaperone bipA n=1 Tax=Macrolepiota fuliginosa MF-IS2 TaxID=1400762 RepID=A0A9P6BZP4_9AGAR|nr:dnaK-type molecular chaperone bipA [Macrolepiota fuliginosa MF-IS2]